MMPKIPSETAQNRSSDKTSVMVVIKGLANTAGSIWMVLAKMGTQQPTILATMTAKAMATATAAE